MIAERKEGGEKTFLRKALTVVYFLFILYLFFLCIEMMGAGFKLFGEDIANELMRLTENPIVGLFIGILATSIMQSSSSTTSIVVGMVAAGTLSVELAIPIVMGANIGTSVTNTVVSLGHMQRKKEFELAFAGAVVHDFFNLCTVILFLPLELIWHPLERSAKFVSNVFIGVEGATFESPFDAIVEPPVDLLQFLGEKAFGEGSMILAVVFVIVALGLLIFTLSRITKIMRGALASRLEVLVDRYLFTGTFRGFFIGAGVTAIVQSSSITTCLVVPLLGAGIIRLEKVFPYMVGANLGTTFTALLASLVTGQQTAVTIALCHLFFNLFGAVIFIPLKIAPISLAKGFGKITAERRWLALVYVGVVFFLVPLVLIFLT
ncbi:MAG: Na/Pi symporter [bacterium]